MKEGQVDPQPRATSPRPALPLLRGANVTGFKAMGMDSTARSGALEFQIAGKPGKVNFRIEEATAGDGDPSARQAVRRRSRGPTLATG